MAVIQEAYLKGVSTRSVDQLVQSIWVRDSCWLRQPLVSAWLLKKNVVLTAGSGQLRME